MYGSKFEVVTNGWGVWKSYIADDKSSALIKLLYTLRGLTLSEYPNAHVEKLNIILVVTRWLGLYAVQNIEWVSG